MRFGATEARRRGEQRAAAAAIATSGDWGVSKGGQRGREGRAQFYVRPLQLQYEESWSRFRTEIVCCKIRANVACGIHTTAQEIGRVVSFDPVSMN